MPSPLASLLDKRRLAMTKARFSAWWQGEDFDEEAALRAIDEAANGEPAEPPLDLFEPDAPVLNARMLALTKLWGDGRIMPGDPTAEKLVPAQLGAGEGALIGVLGPGYVQPVLSLAEAHKGSIAVFEWREETASTLNAALAIAKLGTRVTDQRVDLEAHNWEAAHFDGFWSLDEFTYADEPTRLAHRIARALKPGACCVVEAYAGFASPDIAPAFAAAFAEPHIRAAGDIAHYLMEAGLKLEAQDDLTEEHVELARAGFKRLEVALGEAAKLDVSTARELAWEAEAWRMRLKLLTKGALERRRVIARRPA